MTVSSATRGLGIVVGMNGVSLVTPGAGVLFRYLRQHPAPQA